MARIAIIDDDMAVDILVSSLRYRGHDAFRLKSADEALDKIDVLCASDLIILDIIMSWPAEKLGADFSDHQSAGMEVYKEIRARKQELPIFVHSAIQDHNVIDIIDDDHFSKFFSKYETSQRDFIKQINQQIGIGDVSLPTSFIVHGHDDLTKLELKNYLQNVLGLPEPIILHEKPNRGRTIIEKFEDCTIDVDLVFVILTPDDLLANTDDSEDKKWFARQNVIFEMGFFLGILGRSSGRVILLYKTGCDLPSDISGLIYIDVSKGIESAGENIRKEINHVRDSS